MNNDYLGILQYIYAPTATIVRKMYAICFDKIDKSNTKTQVIDEVLSTHWSNATASEAKMEQEFWNHYKTLIEEKGLFTEAFLYMRDMFHDGCYEYNKLQNDKSELRDGKKDG